MLMVNDGAIVYFIQGSMIENATRKNTLTSYPTIEGTSFSDHYYRDPESVSFQLLLSEVSRPLVYSVSADEDGNRVERALGVSEVNELLKSWFRNATRLEITSYRFSFKNMVLSQYSWSESDLAVFDPSLSFEEARVQTLRMGVIENPDQYYQAAYGSVISVGGAAAVESPVNIGSALFAGGTGAAVGAMIGSVIPGIGNAVGALVGGGIGFFGNILGIG